MKSLREKQIEYKIFFNSKLEFLKEKFNTYTEKEDGQGKSSQIDSTML